MQMQANKVVNTAVLLNTETSGADTAGRER